jgi:8-oxo-dGTP diphosphatase
MSSTSGSARARQVEAAGAVLWRGDPARPDQVEVALVHRPKYDDWSLPKGKLKHGEHPFAAAVREVREETGQAVTLGRPLPSQRYPLPDGRAKRVRYWLCRAEPEAEFTPSAEVDRLSWFDLPAARRRLSYARDEGVLAGLETQPLVTSPLVLLRHATAVPRDRWHAAGHIDDTPRPLSGQGEAEAQALAAPLGALGSLEVRSSQTRRCLDTVAPYVAATGVRTRIEPAFSEAGLTADPDQARQRVRQLADTGLPALVCSHRLVLPMLLHTLCERHGFGSAPTAIEEAPRAGTELSTGWPASRFQLAELPLTRSWTSRVRSVELPTAGPEGTRRELPPAWFWVLHLAAGRVCALRRWHP